MQDSQIIPIQNTSIDLATTKNIPAIFTQAGDRASFRFVEFFTASIRNANTRTAYLTAVNRFFSWCDKYGLQLQHINPLHVASYIEQLGQELSIPTVKQHLSAINKLFDFLVVGHIREANPAHSVTAPKYSVSKGKTPILTAEEAKELLQSIDTTKIAGIRDKAIIALMVYSFARIGAVVAMNKSDYFCKGKRWWIRLHEKGSKYHEMPLHHKAEEYLDAYIQTVQMEDEKKAPLFRTLNRQRQLTTTRIDRRDCWRMVKKRAKQAGLSDELCNHSFRGTGITVFLENGGKLEDAQRMANHASSKTTKLYDRRNDDVTVEMVELVRI